MTRTGTIAWSVLGIIGFAFFLVCGAWVAIFAFALSIDAPHAWKGDVRIGLIYGLIALALIRRHPFAPRLDPPFALAASGPHGWGQPAVKRARNEGHHR